MDRVQMNRIEDYFEFFVLFFFIVLFFYIIQDFLLVLFIASTIVFLTYPIYTFLSRKTRNNTISALLILFMVLVLLILPIGFVSYTMYQQSDMLYSSSISALENIDLSSCSVDVCRQLQEQLPKLDLTFEKGLDLVVSFLSNSSVQIFSSITSVVLQFVIMILAVYFLLKEGHNLVKYLRRIIPMREKYKDALFKKFRVASLAVFVDNILVAIIQGTLTGIGLWIFGISNPFFWAIIASLLAIIPYLGPTVVWLPSAMYLIFSGNFFAGIFLIIYGATVVGWSDNILRPLLLRGKMKVHPFLILLSILGGINTLGIFMGIFIGPIIVSFLVAIIDIYKIDFR